MPLSPCLLCGGSLRDARQVSVCRDCHGKLAISATAQVASTGEYTAMSDEAVARILAEGEMPALLKPVAAVCTWCGKAADQVKKILRGNDACICNECVGLCADVMEAELGEDWR